MLKQTATFTNAELLEMEKLLDKYSSVKHVKFAYMLARNMSAIRTPLKDFREVIKIPEKVIEFEQNKEKLLNEHAKKDEKGRAIRHPISERPGTWQYELEDSDAYQKALSDLEEEYPTIQQEVEEHNQRQKELLEENVDINLYVLDMSKLPMDDTDEGIIEAKDLSYFLEWGLLADDDKLVNLDERRQADDK